jgi:hypothetical protein
VTDDGQDSSEVLLTECETLVFYGGPDDPRNAWVKLVHRETGIEAEAPSESTQVENRALALRILAELLGR